VYVEWHRQQCGFSPTKKLRELVNQPLSPVIMASSPPLIDINGVFTDAVQEEEVDVDLWLTSPFPRRVISLCVTLTKLRCRKVLQAWQVLIRSESRRHLFLGEERWKECFLLTGASQHCSGCVILWMDGSVEEVGSIRLVPWTALLSSSEVKVRDYMVRQLPVPVRLCTGLLLSPEDRREVLDAQAQAMLRKRASKIGRLIHLWLYSDESRLSRVNVLFQHWVQIFFISEMTVGATVKAVGEDNTVPEFLVQPVVTRYENELYKRTHQHTAGSGEVHSGAKVSDNGAVPAEAVD